MERPGPLTDVLYFELLPFLDLWIRPRGCSRYDWVINYVKEQTLTMGLDMKRKHPSMLIMATPCEVCVMRLRRKQDSGRAKEDYRLLLTMSHSDKWNMSHISSNGSLNYSSNLGCLASWFLVSPKKKWVSLFQAHNVGMFDMMPDIWAEIIHTTAGFCAS